MDNDKKIAIIKRKTRRRYVFTLMTLALYFSFALNWTEAGSSLGVLLGDTHISGSVVMFAGIIIIMVCFELLFLALNRDGGDS